MRPLPLPLPPPRGILPASRPDGLLDGRRIIPSPQLAPYIHHYGSNRRSFRSPFTAETLPHSAAQILRIGSTAERSAVVPGVRWGALARTLTDEGKTFGVRFRPVMLPIQLRATDPPSLAALAASLGYADQAHFRRDFKRTVGQTPRAFGHARSAARCRAMPRDAARLMRWSSSESHGGFSTRIAAAATSDWSV